jgi:methanogenic corrinoid protein MtbC1
MLGGLGHLDSHAIQARLIQERAHLGSWHAVAERLGELLSEIGRQWESGRLSVIEEHLATAALQRALGVVIESLPLSPSAPRCLLAVPEGDQHTLGLTLVELCLREAGWRGEWAGSHTRIVDIVERVSAGGLDMVALSAAASASDSAMLQATVNTVGAACRAANVALALGGRGAWPAAPGVGILFRTFADFYEFAIARREQTRGSGGA